MSESKAKGFLEHAILPLFLISHIRCVYCGDRYATFGFGPGRIVFQQSTSQAAARAAFVLLCAAAAAGAAFLLLR